MMYRLLPGVRAASVLVYAIACLGWGKSYADDTLAFELEYIVESFSLVSGGNDKGTTYHDNLYVGLEKSWPERGTTLYVSGIYNNGHGISANRVGDALTISNIEAPVEAARAYEVWIEQKSANETMSLKVGLLDVNAEFDVLETSGLFIGGSHGNGADFGQTGENGPSVFPVTAFGVRGDAQLSDALTLRFAALDAVPGDPDRPKRTVIKFGEDEGLFLISELEYKTERSKVLASYWSYTADFEAHDGSTSGGNDGFYLRGETQLTGAAEDKGLYAFARAGTANGKLNPFSAFYSAGLQYKGPWAEDGSDALGFAVAWAETSSDFQRFNPTAPDREVALELTYQRQVTDWLTLQPDVQYIINPFEGEENALAVGLRAIFSLP